MEESHLKRSVELHHDADRGGCPELARIQCFCHEDHEPARERGSTRAKAIEVSGIEDDLPDELIARIRGLKEPVYVHEYVLR